MQCDAASCCVRITDGVNIYLQMRLCLLAPICSVCLCLFMGYQSRVLSKTMSSVSNLKYVSCDVASSTQRSAASIKISRLI